MVKFEKEIEALALKNALEFGSANPSKILPKLFQYGLKKHQIKTVFPSILKIVKKINTLSKEEREILFSNYKDIIKERKEIGKGLSSLPNPKKEMVFRISPFPSGAIHIGNAKTFILNNLYKEKYKGKLILVMDDTIGSLEKSIDKNSYKLIKNGLKWLGIKYNGKIIYKSDRLEIYYKYAERIIKKGKAYVCHCTKEELRENREKGRECSCRVFPIKNQLKRWKKMFKMDQGKAILRIKTNMLDPNPAFRDRVLFKISKRNHPLVGKKYTIWPTLEMSWAIDDHLLGITHILRGNDLLIETDMERYIWDIFSWEHPQVIHTGMIVMEGIKVSKSKSQKEVKTGKFIGWDDPRTWSIQSLQRRGIQPEAVIEFVKSIGLNKQDITVPIESLYAINRRLIDSESLRYSFIQDPFKLELSNKPNWKKISIPIHPDKDEKRELILKKDIYISKRDYEKFKKEEVRLLYLYNVSLNKKEVTSIDNKNIKKINWVSDFINVKILKEDGSWVKGIADSGIKSLKKGEIIQFERWGFVRFDKINKDKIFEFWFAHK